MKNTLSKSITKVLFHFAVIFAVLLPAGLKAHAEEYAVVDAGYLSSKGSTELRETESTGEVDNYFIKFKVKKDGYVTFTAKTPRIKITAELFTASGDCATLPNNP